MKKEDLVILILGLLLLAGMLITIFLGGEESRHGVGSLPDILPAREAMTVTGAGTGVPS